jgi:hypothetical protein
VFFILVWANDPYLIIHVSLEVPSVAQPLLLRNYMLHNSLWIAFLVDFGRLRDFHLIIPIIPVLLMILLWMHLSLLSMLFSSFYADAVPLAPSVGLECTCL